MFKKLLPLLASLSLIVATSCNKGTTVEPSMPTTSVSQAANENIEGLSDTPTKVGSTKAGDIYAHRGSDEELAQALKVLKAHPETPYDEFDLSSITVTEVAKQGKSYGFTSLKSSTRVLGIAGWGTDSAQPIIVEITTDKETSEATVQYFNYVAGTVTSVTNGPKGVTSTTSTVGGRLAPSTPCGNAVMACITDAYSNHGWISVWAGLQSAVIPFTAFAIAADCALHNC